MLFLIFLDWALDVNTKVLCFPSCHSMLVLEARAVFQQRKRENVEIVTGHVLTEEDARNWKEERKENTH